MLQELGQKEGLFCVQVCSQQLHQARMLDLAHDVNLLQQIPRGMQEPFSVCRVDIPEEVGPSRTCQAQKANMLRIVEEFQPVSICF